MDAALSGIRAMSLRNMNIAPRAFTGFALIGGLMLILGVFALNQMSKIRGAAEDITNSSVPSIKNLDEFTQLTLRLRVLSYRLLVNREPDVQQKTMELLDTRNQQIRAAQSAYEPLISGPQERAAYDQYVQLLGQYRQIEDRMKTLSRNNQVDELRNLLNTDLLNNSEAVNAVLSRLLEINTQQTRDTNQQAADQYDSAFDLVIALLVAATALTLALAWLLINSITKPIANALGAAESIAEGNLTRPITVDGEDEAGAEGGGSEQDPMYDQAVEVVLKKRKASISLVQRELRIGYNRAARLLEDMERAGLVSSLSTSGQRDILVPNREE